MTAVGGDWSETRIVRRPPPPPVQVGELAEIRRRERRERRARRGRLRWPFAVTVLAGVIVGCLFALDAVLSMR